MTESRNYSNLNLFYSPMSKEQAFESIEILQKRVNEHLSMIIQGTCSMEEMDRLLTDLRELEERLIIIRYRAMEAISGKGDREEEKVNESEATVREPEIDFSEALEEEVPLPDSDTNQISLIDSIEEISREVSLNENHSEATGPSLAEKLEEAAIPSIMKALSVNQKMGIVNQLFKGDDSQFKALIESLDSASDKDVALKLFAESEAGNADEEHPLVLDIKELIDRRFP